ncbi:MAG TPA: MerR family DNA-binding protein [Pyrinomonadaceae bacterium]|jgi:MerR family mercuric resistance operon transcriptional regulator
MIKTGKRENYTKETTVGRGSLKIGEVSSLSGVGIEALRFYERSGLLGKPLRSMSGYRLYDEGVLERLAFIKKAQTLGFSLDEIKQIISDAQSGASPCEDVREIVRRRLAELDERMREMRRYRKELAQTLEEWDKVGRAPGHICGLIETAEIENPISPKRRITPKKRHK